MEKKNSFGVVDLADFKIQMLNWVNRFSIFCYLDNQDYDITDPAFECLLAAGCKKNILFSGPGAIEALKEFAGRVKNEWLFGHLGYDLKNGDDEPERIVFDGIGFSDLHFFVPEIVVKVNNNEVQIFSEQDPAVVLQEILRFPKTIDESGQEAIAIKDRISREEYIQIIQQIRQHILRGDCYELNFCQEYFAEKVSLKPLTLFHRLLHLSPNPFSAFYREGDKYCMCASPERYLRKKDNRVISQPIKGTSKRDLTNPVQDEALKQYLVQSSKERSENVMVVDLVRNDLSLVCVPGSVRVDELFGLYSFPQVHQMVSTISGELREGQDWVDCIRASFPMGSMTGAPKKRVMDLIGQYEQTRRGLFSGAVGYISPSGDFDFNVVIRTLLYNAANRYVSFQTGSGITFYSNAENEYEECQLKAAAIKSILNGQ